MRCPYCSANDDRVLDTRIQKDGEGIRRRRECLVCKARFTTQESILLDLPAVVKKDGRREAFSKEKIRNGLRAACQKRAISPMEIEAIVDRIVSWSNEKSDREITASAIGQRVMSELKKLDHVAYVRFASVYRTFKDINEFVETLEEIDNGSPGNNKPPGADLL